MAGKIRPPWNPLGTSMTILSPPELILRPPSTILEALGANRGTSSAPFWQLRASRRSYLEGEGSATSKGRERSKTEKEASAFEQEAGKVKR